MNVDAVLQQRVDEFSGRREVRLIGRNDVAARIARFRIVQNACIKLAWHAAAAAAEAPAGSIAARYRFGSAAAATTASSTTSATRGLHLRSGRFERRDSLGRDRPGIFISLFDGVPSHLIDVVEERFAIARRDVQHGAIVRHFVIDRLAIVPFLIAHGRRDRQRPIALREVVYRRPAEYPSASDCR